MAWEEYSKTSEVDWTAGRRDDWLSRRSARTCHHIGHARLFRRQPKRLEALRRRFPFPRQALCLGELVRGHLTGYDIPKFNRFFVALRGRKVEPHMREYVVLRDAACALGVHGAEVVLGEGKALVGSEAPPFHSL